MKINLVKLWQEPGAKEEFTFVWDDYSGNFEEVSLTKPSKVKGNISNRGNYLELVIKIETEIALPCSRCLEEVRLPFKIEFNEQFGSEEEWLDLKQVVQESVLLNLPMRILCTPDCPGICPECGKNLKEGSCNCHQQNLDLRFEVLAQLKKKLES